MAQNSEAMLESTSDEKTMAKANLRRRKRLAIKQHDSDRKSVLLGHLAGIELLSRPTWEATGPNQKSVH
jgi:hypothetical protein